MPKKEINHYNNQITTVFFKKIFFLISAVLLQYLLYFPQCLLIDYDILILQSLLSAPYLFVCINTWLYLIRKLSVQPLLVMRKAFMIVHQVREPSLLPIQLLTQFENLDQKEANPAQTIARFFLYTKSSVYQGELKKIDINNQLAWNEKCISALTDSLSGRRSNIDIRFNEEIEDVRHSEMSLICEIETSINVRLFQIVMFKIPEALPMSHMKRVFMNYKDVYLDQEKKLKQEKERILLETKECVALEKQIEEQTLTEIAHIKKNFIDVINVCKKQLRKHMKSGITDFINQQEQIAEDQAISKRKIVRVNRQALQNAGASKTQAQQQEKQDESLDMLFK